MIPGAALDDLKVLDLSQGLAGPLCAKILADFGADVLKVEPPEGDCARRMAPFWGDDPHPDKSLIFLLANLNKQGVKLDLESPEGAGLLRKLVRTADVVVESFRPGYLDSLGLGYAALQRENPALIMVSITPFGQTGPYSGFAAEEIVTYATSGIMSISGTTDREPLKHGGLQSQYEGGLCGAVATAIGVYTRDLTGEGQHIDLSLQEVVTSTLIVHQPFYSWAGAVQGRRPPGGRGSGNVQPCKDGYFVWQAGGGAQWQDIAEFFARDELKDERFATVAGRAVHADELDELVLDATKDRTMAELFKTASEKYRMLFGIAQEPKDLADCPHLEAREFYQNVSHPELGDIDVPFRMWSMSEGGATYRRPPPRLGEHNADIYGRILGLSGEEISALSAKGVI
jgi:crotonobetainyl-CoA:carnitine CoA-transferase CaiB-like acyl-CoA transferase